jgi:hypothetical protein
MKRSLLLLLIVSGMISCDKDEDEGNLRLTLTGLPDLGVNHAYEGWIIVNGNPISTGTFTVNSSGQLSRSEFMVDKGQLQGATAFVLTIEPRPDNNPAPSGIKILAGDFAANTASVSVSHSSALGSSFSTASGFYILATPTNGMGTNENSGVWFLNPAGGPGPSLNLPALPAEWKYEGWAVINGTPLTTGKFSMPAGADEAAPFSGPMAGPPFPGEDYLMNAPTGITFPTNLAGQKIVITIEPNPDNNPAPFGLKPLSGDVPAGATDHVSYTLTNIALAGNPAGSVTR